MFIYQEKVTRRHTRGQKHSVKRQKASELDSDTEGTLELLEEEFKTTMINMLRALMDKWKARKNGSKMGILRKNKYEKLKNICNRNEE